ncbi:MAG: sensor histidine kinase [Lachnospiraceae bacterium]
MLRRLWTTCRNGYHNISLRYIVWISFTVTAAVATIIMGLSFYNRFSGQLKSEIQREDQSLIEQVNSSLGTYIRNMMKVSDTLCYSVIKDADIHNTDLYSSFQLLYDTNKDYIKNITLFTEDGAPVVMAPAATLRTNVQPDKATWFRQALNKPENQHFSNPHVQNLYVDSDYQYDWVISLSRAVQITDGTRTKQGVLLIDLNYNGLKQIFSHVSLGQTGYLYLMDQMGNIIYHPKQQLLNSNQIQENNQVAITYKDGIHKEDYKGESRIVTVESVGYTGWAIVGVTSGETVSLNSIKSNLFFLFLFLFFILVLVVINSYISEKVSRPIQNLEQAVKEVESGNLDADIVAEGFFEVRHLGQSVQNMARQMKKLMDDIVVEHESKRKSELDTLQSQINPHFLYNTLDTIVWMIENEQQQDASRAVTALARFFRISLSKGKNIIAVEDEIEHVRNYLAIQKMRYKNRFVYKIVVEEKVKKMATIKLILQPLVENAIYHGMEFMDGDGEIYIHAYCKDDMLYLSVKDNGLGMTEEMVKKLLHGEVTPSKRGSGIGVRNVDERIRLYFGTEYGLIIASEPDEGTEMTAHLPMMLYEENREQ